jgi:hypothetical protein
LRAFARLALASALWAAAGADAMAQVAPDARWMSFSTARFRVHFAPGLEDVARRAAWHAERAYDRLSADFVSPRGTIDIVVSDDIDLSNGTATPFPSNRIVIYAAPPVEVSALSDRDDWLELVVVHELVHIFHLDRVRGPWRMAQTLFGRAPFLFPAAYAPSWLTEGLAVHYETLITGSGRLAGSHHRMIARAAAIDHRIPRLDQWSVATPAFPGGNTAYVYGSLFVEHIARTRGDSVIPQLVESGAVQLVPFWLNRQARAATGVTFDRLWREWRDSLASMAGAQPVGEPLPGWRALATQNFIAGYPRWLDDSTIYYAGAAPRELLGARTVDLFGRRGMLGRLNSSTPSAWSGDGARVFAQHDLLDPYRYRSDLYREQGGVTTRLTRGARLLEPDVRNDGWIVATQLVPGGSRIVVLAPNAERLLPLTGGNGDEQWTSPRFSPDGSRIAAILRQRGGHSIVMLLSPEGQQLGGTFGSRGVLSGVSWTSDGASLLVSSDVEGRADIYLVPVDEDGAPRRLSATATGFFHPEPSPDGRRLAAIQFTARGFEVGVADLRTTPGAEAADPPAGREEPRPLPQVVAIGDSARRYSAWRSVLPRYWLPLIVAENGTTSLGAMSSGRDVVGRHEWAADLLMPLGDAGATWGATYRYAGLGVPWLEFSAAQAWATPRAIVSQGEVVGEFRRRSREATLAATFLRPRVRTAMSASLGVGVRMRDFETRPRELIDRLNPRARSDSVTPRLFASASFSSTRRAVHAISPEEGFTAFGLVNQRWGRRWTATADGDQPERIVTHTLIGATSAYLPLELPGFARHVLAMRIAGGSADSRGADVLDVGGVSGTPLAVLPGYTLGEGRRTFPVRGFSDGALSGWKAVATSAEYRAPILMPARGLSMLPLFLDRTSVSVFADAGGIWCDGRTMVACGASAADRSQIWIASTGAEVNVDAAVFSWDLPYRLRGGVAVPVAGRERSGANPMTVYFAAGLAF